MARMIKAGKYNKLITLQQRDYKREKARGENNPIWRTVTTVRASVEPVQGREYFSGAFQMGENVTRIRIRYREGVTNKMRVKYGKRLFDVESVIDSFEQHRELQLICKEGEAHGEY